MKLYVGNLDYTMTGIELGTLFAAYGQVTSARIITDHYTRQSKCFGYVEMPACEGHKALEELDGSTVNHRSLVVREARSREERLGLGW